MEDGILHSKLTVVDGVWSVIGSSNFDHRSILFNDEVDAVVLGRDTAAQLEASFEKEEQAARPITREEWEDRPITQRLREVYAHLLTNLL